MIKKERKKPLRILKTEAAIRRLRDDHLKKKLLEEDLAKSMAGYRGETALDYHIGFLDKNRYFIFHDLRLSVDGHYFQIDTLILSPSFILILEIKNILGTVFFENTFQQFTRTLNDTEVGLDNPVIQVKKHSALFQKWLKANNFFKIPLESVVVFSNSSTIIKTDNRNKDFSKIIHGLNLPNKVAVLEKIHHHDILTKKDISRLSRVILKKHTLLDFNILERYGIKREEIIKGVQCSNCQSFSMKRARGAWHCPDCYFTSKNAYIYAIRDFALLFQLTITNRELRDFLQLKSESIATKLLAASGLPKTGTTKNTIYHLPLTE